MFALILCSIKHIFIHRTIWNTITNHSQFPLFALMHPQWWQIHQFLNDKITWEFSKQNTYLLPYRKVQYFRITCIVLVTNGMITFWRQVLAYSQPKTLHDIQPRRKSLSVLCRGVLQLHEPQQCRQAYSLLAANSRNHHWLGSLHLKWNNVISSTVLLLLTFAKPSQRQVRPQ